MKILAVIIIYFFIYYGDCFAQNTTIPEQVAVVFFAHKIAPIAIPEIKKIYYTGKTDSTISSVYMKCLVNDSLFSNRDTITLINSKVNPAIDNGFLIPQYYSIPKAIFCESMKLTDNRKKLKCKREGFVVVFNAIKIRNYSYVELFLFSMDNAIVSFIVELNQNNDVSNWCYE